MVSFTSDLTVHDLLTWKVIYPDLEKQTLGCSDTLILWRRTYTYSLSCGKFLYTKYITEAADKKIATKMRSDIRAEPPSAWAFPEIKQNVML